MTKSTPLKALHIGKTILSNFMKWGCQCCFVANKPYLDHSLCSLIYKNIVYLNVGGKHSHGTMVNGFRYALGVGLSKEMKSNIVQMHLYRLSPTQNTQQHTKKVQKLVVFNGLVTRDTLLLPSNSQNICHKKAKELWKKHPHDPINICMWIVDNPNNAFYNQKCFVMDLDSQTQDDSPFILVIETKRKLELMAKFGCNNTLSINATLGTNHTRMRYKSIFFGFLFV